MKQMKQMKQYIIGMLFVLFLCPVSVYANDSEGVISSTSETQSSAIVNTENVLNEIPKESQLNLKLENKRINSFH